MRTNNPGLRALTTSKERQELRAVGVKPRLILKYHKGSEKIGKAYGIDARLWDVLSPRIPGYNYDANSGPVTLSVMGMRERGLL